MDDVTELMDPTKWEQLMKLALGFVTTYGPKLIAAIVIFYVGKIVAKWIRRLVVRGMEKAGIDSMIVGFSASMVYIGLMVFVVLAALGQLGIQTTSFLAVLGAAGLAIGLALKGSLSNFAAGFMMIIFRPFKVGDFIEAAGVSGKVDTIHIFTTTLRTGDNKLIIIPNAKLNEDNIVNYSALETRRVDLVVGVSYDADLAHVRRVLEDILASDERILRDPEWFIGVGELADNSVNFTLRVWTKRGDYWPVFFDLNETIKVRFDKEGIGIPYPQRDVHLYQQTA